MDWYFFRTRRAAPLSVVGNLTLLFGPLMLVAGLVIGGYRVLCGGDSTTGEVVDVIHRADGTSAPVVTYEVDGHQYVHESDSFISAELHDGETLEVRYNPDNPRDARVVTFMGTWMLPLTLTGIGGLFVIVGLSMLRRRLR